LHHNVEGERPRDGRAEEQLRDEVTALVRRLIACDTSNPPGREAQAAAVATLACILVMREEYGSIAYGFIPFRHGDPMVNLETKHGADERVLVDDLVFQARRRDLCPAAATCGNADRRPATRDAAGSSGATRSILEGASKRPRRTVRCPQRALRARCG
jgi:hypothetical protein